MISGGIDDYSYLIDRRHRLLLIGIVLLLLSGAMMLTGQTWVPRGSSTVTRWENPARFWRTVACWIVLGLVLIVVFLYRISN